MSRLMHYVWYHTFIVSRLWFTLPPSESINVDDTEEMNGTGTDQDGDLMLRRKTSKCEEIGERSVLTIGTYSNIKTKDLPQCGCIKLDKWMKS